MKYNILLILAFTFAFSKFLSIEFYDYYLLFVLIPLLTFHFYNLNTKIKYVLVNAFLVRVIACLISFYDFAILEGANSDAIYFVNTALSYPVDNLFDAYKYYLSQGEFYSFFIWIIFSIFNKSELFLALINVVFSTYVVQYTYKIANNLYSNKAAKIAAIFIAFAPYCIIFGVTIIREAIITFLFTFSLYNLLIFKNSAKIINILLVIFCLILSMFFHGGMISVFIAITIALIIFMAFSFFNNISRLIIGSLFFFILLSTVFTLVSNTNIYKIGFLKELNSQNYQSEIFRNVGYSIKGRNYREEVKITSFTDLITKSPDVFLPFLYQPYPWRFWELKRLAILFLGSTTWIILTLIFLLKYKIILSKSDSKYLLLICFITLLGFAYGSSQINQAIRHNHKILPVVVAVFSIGLQRYFNVKYTFNK